MTTPWDTLSAALEELDTTQTQAANAIAKAENAVSRCGGCTGQRQGRTG